MNSIKRWSLNESNNLRVFFPLFFIFMLMRCFDGGIYRVLEDIETDGPTHYRHMYIVYGRCLDNSYKNDELCRQSKR